MAGPDVFHHESVDTSEYSCWIRVPPAGPSKVLMVGACMLACAVPSMRALRMLPTEAPRAD